MSSIGWLAKFSSAVPGRSLVNSSRKKKEGEEDREREREGEKEGEEREREKKNMQIDSQQRAVS